MLLIPLAQRITFFVFLSIMLFSPIFAETKDNMNADLGSSDIAKLELAGDDSFEYDVNNKIRKTKSGFNIGIGINITQHTYSHALQVNASTIFGYSYFFHKTFGLRTHGIFDNTQGRFYIGGGLDVIWDFLQLESFGLGIFVGSSVGYEKRLLTNTTSGILAQSHVGASMVFDSGRNRIDMAIRMPYNKIDAFDMFHTRITYALIYSYTF